MDAEKIICCDRDNDNALAAAIYANGRRNDNDWPAWAMMNGGMNNWMNNPFAYMMMFALFRNGFGWGGEGYGFGQGQQNIEMQNQLQAIRTQLQDNQNSNLLMMLSRVTNLLLASWRKTCRLISIHFKSVAAMYRLPFRMLPEKSDSPPKESSMLRMSGILTSSSN